MQTTGISRRIDDTGRIVIPREIRKTLGIKSGDLIEIFTHDKEIVLRKYHSGLGDLAESLHSEFSAVRGELDGETAEKMDMHIHALRELIKNMEEGAI